MYRLDIRPFLKKKLEKFGRRNPKQAEIISKKVREIIQNPNHYKNLRRPLQNWKRVHIDKSFVLTFSVDESRRIVTLEDYDHHSIIYKR